MRIARITCRMHRSGFDDRAEPGAAGGNLCRRAIETLLVRVETEDGLHGWGEGFGFSLAETTRGAALTPHHGFIAVPDAPGLGLEPVT